MATKAAGTFDDALRAHKKAGGPWDRRRSRVLFR
jgi:hypothetical protein